MQTDNANILKELVKSKYSDIAIRSDEQQDLSCCGPVGCCHPSDKLKTGSDSYFNLMSESYGRLEGYQPEADLQLGCGIPVAVAGLKAGQSVLDLGSGAGNDVFVARSIVGEAGQLTGLDFSEAMVQKARQNAKKADFDNVIFVLGDIEDMPFDDHLFDVVLSNCVLNLVPDKIRAFTEMYRVLRSGGHFSISDIVLEGTIPEPVQNAAEAYVGCVSGATQKSDYLEMVRNAGFRDVTIQKEREIIIPDSWFDQVLNSNYTVSITSTALKVLSITLTGKKY
ncbi:MAG: arsenite methyltransferase [Balneolales bacterium]